MHSQEGRLPFGLKTKPGERFCSVGIWAAGSSQRGGRRPGSQPWSYRHPCHTERSSRQLGVTGPKPLSLLQGLNTAHPFPQASQVSAPVGQGAWRACARGHHQHRISFHLCKDSLTPEHINILNDSERNWDSRQPVPPSPLAPPLPTHSPPSFPPSLDSPPLLPFSLMPASLSPLLSPPSHPPLLSPSLLSFLSPLPGPHSSCAFTNFHPTAPGGWRGVPSWASPCLSVHPQLGPDSFWSLEAGPTWWGPGRGNSVLQQLPQRHTGFHGPRQAEKLQSQVWVWDAMGEGRVLGRIFCFVFFMTIYNFAFLPSAPASLAPRCVPH